MWLISELIWSNDSPTNHVTDITIGLMTVLPTMWLILQLIWSNDILTNHVTDIAIDKV